MPLDTFANEAAESVSGWTSLGVKLPKELDQAISVYDAVKFVETAFPASVSIDGLTAENAEAKVRALAEELVYTERGPNGSGISTLDKAKHALQNAAARQVVNRARLAIPSVIEQLEPEFDRVVAEYREAVQQLPQDITSDALVSGGPAAIAAYQTAQQAAGYLDRISSWVASTGSVSGVLAKHAEVVLRILRPENALQLAKLDEARAVGANKALQALNPVYVAAVRYDVPFGINTPRGAASLRSSLAISPRELLTQGS